MLLKAGTYRWNDDIDAITFDEQGEFPIVFSTNYTFNNEGQTVTVTAYCTQVDFAIKGTNPLTDSILYYIIDDTNPNINSLLESTFGVPLPFAFLTYYIGSGDWMYYALNDQSFTIPYDQIVDEWFGLYFKSNTNYNEVNPPTFSTIISKLQSLIDSANAKTGNRDLDLSSAFTSLENGFATLTTKEVTANGTYPASDDNADGYSSVTVNVAGEVLAEYDGTVTVETDSLVGVWEFNDVIEPPSFGYAPSSASYQIFFPCKFRVVDPALTVLRHYFGFVKTATLHYMGYYLEEHGSYYEGYDFNTNQWSIKKVNILEDPEHEEFKEWFRANAKREVSV